MTPDQYRRHPQLALRKAFLRGELSRMAGAELTANPYRQSTSTRRPVRGSFSEAFARAWSVGWKTEEARIAGMEPAIPGASQEGTR